MSEGRAEQGRGAESTDPNFILLAGDRKSTVSVHVGRRFSLRYEWLGRDERGARIIRSSRARPSIWLAVAMAAVSGFFLHGGITVIGTGDEITRIAALPFLALFVLAPAWVAWILLRTNLDLRRLRPEEEIAGALAMTPDELRREAECRGVTPAYRVNDQDFYNPEDFAESMRLLRPASSVEPEVTLLRPAAHSTEADPARLLRAAEWRDEADPAGQGAILRSSYQIDHVGEVAGAESVIDVHDGHAGRA